MSLSLSTDGVAYNTTAVLPTTVALGAVNAATFDAGNAVAECGKLILLIDTTTGDADLADLALPNAIGAADGTTIACVNGSNSNKIIYTDPNTGYSFSYVNRQGESLTLVATNNAWIVEF
jgi:hypothetical protein